MIIKGHEIKKGYLWFFLTSFIGLISGIHSFWLTSKGPPPSSVIHLVYVSNIVVVFLAIITPVVAVYILIDRDGANVLSRLFWITMVIAVSLCLIVIVRGLTWLLLPGYKRSRDLKSFLYLREKKSEPPSHTTIHMSRTKECCGIESLADWEEIYLEVDSVKEDVRPRKLPDFCCINATFGCGTRYLSEIYDAMDFIVSNCDDVDADHSEGCRTAREALVPHVPKNIPTIPEKIVFQPPLARHGTIYLASVSDPRIDAAVDKQSLLEQPSIQNICKLPSNVSFHVHVMVYYKGFVKPGQVRYENGAEKNVSQPCYPDQVDQEKSLAAALRQCQEDLVAINYFAHAFGFCNWLNFDSTSNESRFTLQERAELVQRDGRLYYEGCKPYIERFLDEYAITVVIYSTMLICLFCVLMHHYHRYYFDFRNPMLQTMPMPRWYEPLPHEVPLMHSFGNLDFIPDGNCKKLPPLPCRLEWELGLDEGANGEAVQDNPELSAELSKLEEADNVAIGI